MASNGGSVDLLKQLKRLLKRARNVFYLLKFLYENQSFYKRFLIASGVSTALIVLIIKSARKLRSYFGARTRSSKPKQNAITSHRQSPAINKKFFKELLYLVKIMFPKLISKQSGLLFIHSSTLICRTFLSLYVAKLEGLLAKNIVQKNFASFARYLLQWLLIALPATTCNSLIRYLECKLDLELKSELIKKAHNHYFKDRVYYKIALKQTENTQVDQNLTEDVDKLVQLLVHLYSQLTKPILDIALVTYTLISLAKSKNFNYKLPTLIGLVVISLTGSLMRRISPKFGKMAADVAKQKGYLRFLYTRIQTNSEEIAFYSGEKIEADLINKNYKMLKKRQEVVYLHKLWFVIVEQFLLKYVWSAAGLCMISLPLLLSDQNGNKIEKSVRDLDKFEASEISQRTEDFTTSKNLLGSAADAVERIMTSYKEVVELSGFTSRVYEMFQLFYTANDTTNNMVEFSKGLTNLNNNEIVRVNRDPPVVCESNEIKNIVVDAISVVTPGRDIIVPSLSLKIEQGMNLLITGPNGCGKSSLFRILSSLWPLYNGRIHRPKINEMFYVPQRPYLAIGSLRDQIIYPDNLNDMRRKNFTDKDLIEILEIVNLQQVVLREGGLDAVADWKDVLSGGEKQRLGLSRLFYHKPKFAFLDECTSAVSIDVEGKIYCKAINEYKITLLTIAHRATLWQYHNYILQFDGHGNWKFEELNSKLSDRLNLKQEKDLLEKQLLSVSDSKIRLKELCEILGESSIAL